ncbi:MAG: glycosyltransferase family 1 protein [Patescibacteria group bacterium]|nr:glycosyltransferase family 1 protein [Patescibacteria group bacterium]
MKIAIDARMFGPEVATGIGLYIKKIIEGLVMSDSKNSYDLLVTQEMYDKIGNLGPKFRKIVVKSKWYSIFEQLELPFILYKNRYDLVHFPQFNVPVLYRKKFVVTIHDLTQYFYPGPSSKKNFLRRLAYRAILKNAILSSAKIITVSQHTKSNIIKYFLADPEKIIVTYLGVDKIFGMPIDELETKKVLSNYHIIGDYVLYVGVFRDHKNIVGLIKAFNIFKKDNTKAKLVLVGELDPRYPEVETEISLSQYSNDIIVTGFINENHLAHIFGGAKIFILPSFCEGFGLVAIEAAISGVPVLSSKTNSIPEILGATAAYFDPNNIKQIAELMAKYWNDDNLRNSLSSQALLMVKKYDWHTTVSETIAVYEHS